MAKKKRKSGHYCIVCGNRKANERFSGKGHTRHICKKCSKKSPEEQQEGIDINRLYNLCKYSNLSKSNKKMLNDFLNDKRENVRKTAQRIEDWFYPKFDDELEWYVVEESEIPDEYDENYEFFNPRLWDGVFDNPVDFNEEDENFIDIPF
ncbi:MAG: hypothetical protein KAX49_13170 [Halanaerobiales bacterium]|nr:hypothetical protein [Halanaerobiales bacterium]